MKTISRTLMNEALRPVLSELEGKILDLASGRLASYRTFIRPDRTTVVSADRPEVGALDAVDFDTPLPYEDGQFDHVLLINAIYIAADPVLTLREARRVLKDDGTLVLVAPFVFAESREPHDYFRWTSEGVEQALAKAGFHDARIRPYGGHFTSALYVIELLLYFRLLRLAAQWLARGLDGLVPRRFVSAHPCPLGHVAVCRKTPAA